MAIRQVSWKLQQLRICSSLSRARRQISYVHQHPRRSVLDSSITVRIYALVHRHLVASVMTTSSTATSPSTTISTLAALLLLHNSDLLRAVALHIGRESTLVSLLILCCWTSRRLKSSLWVWRCTALIRATNSSALLSEIATALLILLSLSAAWHAATHYVSSRVSTCTDKILCADEKFAYSSSA
jgi:hypothetical protein